MNVQEISLKHTINGTARVLLDGKVHPLLCGITNWKEAQERTKAVTGILVDSFASHRFYPGEQYLFLAEKFIQKDQAWISLYRPWADELQNVEFVVLECVSQHAVPGEWDDEVKYKGYKFKLVRTNIEHRLLKLGAEFHNQFPRASYGQISTDADWYAELHVTGKEDIHDWIDAKHGSGMMGHFEEASIKIDAIHRGIRQIGERAEKEKIDMSKEINSLKEYLVTLTNAIGEMGFQVQTKPHKSWFLDGRVEVNDWMTDTTVMLK